MKGDSVPGYKQEFEEVSLKEAPECGQGLGSPDICRKVIPPLWSKGGEGAGSGGRGA
ncbi:UNVERIFIED_CONTAM: hypothetical protein FKN15_072697 [Acipenser sinensis]